MVLLLDQPAGRESKLIDPDAVELLCGPVDMAHFTDISSERKCGIVTLSSPQLSRLNTRILLLHLKAIDERPDPREKVAIIFKNAPNLLLNQI